MTHLWLGLIAAATASSGTQDTFEVSGHKASFVTVEPGVQLEVLDWGGTGPDLVLLTGLGDNAHVFDEFAYQFTDMTMASSALKSSFSAFRDSS